MKRSSKLPCLLLALSAILFVFLLSTLKIAWDPDELTGLVRQELDLPPEEDLTYMAQFTRDDHVLVWYLQPWDHSNAYWCVQCRHLPGGGYLLEEVFAPPTYARDIPYTFWMGENLYLINNPNCTTLVCRGPKGDIRTQIDVSVHGWPYLFHLDSPGTWSFLDANGNDIP